MMLHRNHLLKRVALRTWHSSSHPSLITSLITCYLLLSPFLTSPSHPGVYGFHPKKLQESVCCKFVV